MLRDVLTPALRRAARDAASGGTPFYLFDARALIREAELWRREARTAGGVSLFYPYKCNRHGGALDVLAQNGVGAEVTTVADWRAAAGRGLDGPRIVVQGPAKERDLIDAALAARATLVADGREDARAILARARTLGVIPRYLIRFRPTSAGPEQGAFGMTARQVSAFARDLGRAGEPAADGLAFHLGTGIPSRAPFERALGEAARLGIAVGTLDLGGGFASRGERRISPSGRLWPECPAPEAAVGPLAQRATRLFGAGVRLLFEPGRALVSGAFHLVARVVRVRQGDRVRTVYIDASRLSHGPFVPRGFHPIAVLPERRGPRKRFALAGPLGVGDDVFGPAALLPPIEPGDLVVIGSVGAYNGNASNTWAGPCPVRPLR